MAIRVKAKRSRNGQQIDLKAMLLPCRRDHPGAGPSTIKFIVDTASSRTLIRRQAVRGVHARPNQSVYGIAGGRTPATPFRAHLVLLPARGDPQVLTAEILMIDAPDFQEDGVLGLDLVRGLEFQDGEAVVDLATSDADLRGSFNRVTARLDEILGLDECGCLAFLGKALAAENEEAMRSRYTVKPATITWR